MLPLAEDDAALDRAVDELLESREGLTVRVDSPLEPEESSSERVDLRGLKAVVADDDPAAVWFFSDLLRRAGCDVDEASDGDEALDIARRTLPDVVLADIRMPGLDGLRLTCALRADPILSDVPVVLLSWHDDWLQRALDEGVAASAYLGKRSSPDEVLMQVQSTLALHSDLASRFFEPGPVRGLLDGVAPHRLLRLACTIRRDACVTVQSRRETYEVHLRGGAPRAASLVSRDGSVLRGEAALLSLLPVRSGRFVVVAERGTVEADLAGSLHQQVARYVSGARGALLLGASRVAAG